MSSLADSEKKLLLEVARDALIAAVEHRAAPADFPSNAFIRRPAGAFVTLHKHSKLRGCIGQLPGREPLVDVVIHCAASAALDDPRFSAVRPEEVPEIDIEISVLSQLEEVAAEKIERGKHGLVVSRGRERGVLLPQVATQFNWGAERFLEETCQKAGLDRMAWKDPQTRIETFTAEVFSEAGLGLNSSRASAREP
jgi:AmmeMemoRadiSam system protein A